MKQYQQKKSVGNNRVFVTKARENKKVIIAVCLISVMAFMWIRVLTKNEPESAGAARQSNSKAKSGKKQNSNVSFVKLPEIKGRNNALNRDFFDSKGWINFVGEEQEIVTNGNTDEGAEQRMVNRIARKLQLQTIIMGEKPHAFINGKALSIGEKFKLKEGKEDYVFEVKNIEEDRLFLKCKHSEVTLKFKQD